MVAATGNADKLKMLAWDNEDAHLQCDHKGIQLQKPQLVGHCQGEARVLILAE